MSDLEPISDILDSSSAKLLNKTKALHCDACGKDTHPTSEHGKLGGVRSNQGRPVGSINKANLEQQKVKQVFNQLVMRGATKLFNAQFNLALGEQSLFVKRTTGEGAKRKSEVEVVKDVETIKEYLIDDGLSLNQQDDDEYYYLSTKPSNNMAIESLLNRALGKAPDKLEITGGFFSQSNITIEVIGDRNDIIDINSDGTVSLADDGGDGSSSTADQGQAEQDPESSDQVAESSSDS